MVATAARPSAAGHAQASPASAKAEHPHLLRGLSFGGASARPRIVQRTDQEFIPALLAEMATAEGRGKLASSDAKERDARGTLRLYQPVHRTFHVAMLEALCREVGFPRIDAAKLLGMGMVVRRVVPAAGVGDVDAEVHGWMRAGEKQERIVGWTTLDERRRTRDPDPAQRPAPRQAGHPVVDAWLAARAPDDGLAETVAPLFPMPPDVCAAAGRTILYGMVPLTSVESSDVPPAPQPVPDEVLARVLPPFLKAGTRNWGPGDEASSVYATWMDGLAGLGAFTDTPEGKAFRAVLDRTPMLYQLTDDERKALGVKGATEAEAEARRRYDLPDDPGTALVPAGWTASPLGRELLAASEWLARRAPDGKPETPVFAVEETPQRQVGRRLRSARWTVARESARRIAAALKALMQARLATIHPAGGRYDDPDALYRVQAFIRVQRCCDCPPELVWSAPSERFRIVPWFESGAAPPVRVTLPEAKLDSLKKLKPNVTFVTPRSVADALQGMNLKDLAEGKGPGGGGLGLDLVCGFSIPIITLCAFIVLSIFLSLLNIIFWWLPLVKICIPLPRLSPPSPQPPSP
jgi:hypothetical protein